MAILLTGGTGFIGSHTAVELLNTGYDIIIADNLSNSEASVVDRIGTITGKRPIFYEADVADKDAMEKVFSENRIDAVIHFAGYKAVGESVQILVAYYRNNLDTTLTLLGHVGASMQKKRDNTNKKKLTRRKKEKMKTVARSTTDPESGLFVKGKHKRQFAYEAHTACDKHGFVLETVVTPGNVHDSVAFDKVYDTRFSGV